MPFAIIIRGPGGSGKSEISCQLRREIPGLVHMEIDVFKHMISDKSSEARSAIAHDVSSFFLKQLIKNKFNLVIDEIFRKEYYSEVIRILEGSDYKVIKVFLTAPEHVLLERNKKRKKNIDEEIITKLAKDITPLEEDLIIDTSDKSISQVKSIIMKRLDSDGLL